MQPSQAPDFDAKILAYGEVLKHAVDTLRTAPEHWHTTLLIELATENLMNALEVVTGEQQQNACRCAWAARNLLELHYFTRFVIQSPENAQRFHEDMLCDFQDMLKVTAKHPQWASYGVAAQATIDQVWQQPGVNAKKGDAYLSARTIARSFGEEVHYGTTHKLLSKFVHPTAISIQMKKSPAWHILILPMVVETAVPIIGHTFPMLAEHITKHRI
jgi:hypothetical protein